MAKWHESMVMGVDWSVRILERERGLAGANFHLDSIIPIPTGCGGLRRRWESLRRLDLFPVVIEFLTDNPSSGARPVVPARSEYATGDAHPIDSAKFTHSVSSATLFPITDTSFLSVCCT